MFESKGGPKPPNHAETQTNLNYPKGRASFRRPKEGFKDRKRTVNVNMMARKHHAQTCKLNKNNMSKLGVSPSFIR